MKRVDLIVAGVTFAAAIVALPRPSLAQQRTPDEPPPAPASDVRVASDRLGGWLLIWHDNSSDETRFEIGVSIVTEVGARSSVFAQGLGTVPANVTSFRVPVSRFEIPPGCYIATFYVFSARLNTASGWPGNVSLPLCIEETRVTFPTVGSGEAPPRYGHRPGVAVALGAAGALLLLAGGLIRLPRR